MSTVRDSVDRLAEVFREDPDLAEAVSAEDRDQAIEDCTARVLRIPTGPWTCDGSVAPNDGIGLLVPDGLLLRHVGVHGRYAADERAVGFGQTRSRALA